MISAADEAENMVQCVLHGAEDYVSKPLNPILLIASVNACLEKVRLRQNISLQFHLFEEAAAFETMVEMHLRKLVERLLAN